MISEIYKIRETLNEHSCAGLPSSSGGLRSPPRSTRKISQPNMVSAIARKHHGAESSSSLGQWPQLTQHPLCCPTGYYAGFLAAYWHVVSDTEM